MRARDLEVIGNVCQVALTRATGAMSDSFTLSSHLDSFTTLSYGRLKERRSLDGKDFSVGLAVSKGRVSVRLSKHCRPMTGKGAQTEASIVRALSGPKNRRGCGKGSEGLPYGSALAP